MNYIAIAVILGCLPPIIKNKSPEPWTTNDMHILNQYTKKCMIDFKNSPCLSRFIKERTDHYTIRCKAPGK